jgi:hypothetical protein
MAKIRHTKITAAVYVHRIFSCIYDIATCMYTYTAGTCLRAPFALAKRTNANAALRSRTGRVGLCAHDEHDGAQGSGAGAGHSCQTWGCGNGARRREFDSRQEEP